MQEKMTIQQKKTLEDLYKQKCESVESVNMIDKDMIVVTKTLHNFKIIRSIGPRGGKTVVYQKPNGQFVS